MSTTLYFYFNGKAVPQGTEVKVHWAGFFSGYSPYKADADGAVILPDDVLKGNSRKAEHIYVRPKRNDRAYALDNETIYKNKVITYAIDDWRKT